MLIIKLLTVTSKMVYLEVKYLYGFMDWEARGYMLEIPRGERYMCIEVHPICINYSNIEDTVIGIHCTQNGNYNQEEYERLIAFIEEYKAYHNFPNNKTIDLEVHGYICGDIEDYIQDTYDFNSPMSDSESEDSSDEED